MAVVKLKNKKELDKLVANLTLRLGRKVTQQDVLNACIEISAIHIDELERYFLDLPEITEEQIQEILDMAEQFDYDTFKSIDQDIYGD
ncbi:MAG: hypothetical protein ACTSO9_07900 [Candidatus Helarchaeota archaeon]